MVDPLKADPPLVALSLDCPDHMERADLGTLVRSPSEVVQIQGVLGLDAAAEVAVAQMNAGPLLATESIGEALCVGLVCRIIQVRGPVVGVEADCLRDRIKPIQLAQSLGPASDEVPALGPLALRDRGCAEHLAGALDIWLELVRVEGFRPAAVER